MRARCAACLALLLALRLHAAAAAADTMRVEIEPGRQAEVAITPEGRVQVRFLPGDAMQVLQAPVEDWDGQVALGHDDYDFDGRQDLVLSATLGQVNLANVVYRFDPARQRFGLLEVPTNAPTSCEGFWALLPDAATRTLTSSCRGGPMWYTDVYRYTDDGQLYVYQSQQLLEQLAFPPLELPSDDQDDALPLSRWTTYDAHGRVLHRFLGQTPQAGATATVAVSEMALYDAPRAGRARRMLRAGERVELLDLDDGGTWLQVRHGGPGRAAISGWLRLDPLQTP
ncbi:hypothetical protein [Pseudoxanthomonas composti]|uniref:SH3 domain-containing protein n=1 Tax=Pseudoxanthomonas composti TaxID=2137479 RepID=A0A4Q1JU03_9GAMM|nr:hypothetical protein [Pseudoxanthomonas composti]RXR01452.1 hypothetical protein EPA99_16130 [Pseudoxanthomonas composti]